MLNLLTFTVSTFRFALDLERTVKVVPLMSLRTVPKSDRCVVGVMDLGGVSIPVIDLSIRLDLAENPPYTLNTCVVVCRRGDQQFGLIAQTIDGVETITQSVIELDDLLHSDVMPYLGVYRGRRGDQVLLLDLDRILSLTCAVAAPPVLPDTARGEEASAG